jgi:pilus assembly protein CpaB
LATHCEPAALFLTDFVFMIKASRKSEREALVKLKISKHRKNALMCVVCGILCVLCVGAYSASVEAKASSTQAEILSKYGGDQIDVCVAKKDLQAGETISESDIEVKTWIASLLPADAITTKSDAVGKQLGSTVLAGEVISSQRFGFSASEIDVPSDAVAISLPVKEVQAVGGSLQVGMRADVYATGSSKTTRLASSLQILATSGDSSSSSMWITVAVEPNKVEEFVSAAQNLDLYFTLPGADVNTSSSSSSKSTSSSSSSSSSSQSSSSASESSHSTDSEDVSNEGSSAS